MNRLIISLFLCFSALAGYDWPTNYTVREQYESGDFWTAQNHDVLGGGFVSMTNGFGFSGDYSVRCWFPAAAASRVSRLKYSPTYFPNYSTNLPWHVRLYFYAGTNTVIPSTRYTGILLFEGTGGTTEEELRLVNNSGTYQLRSTSISGDFSTITFGQWYCLEARFETNAGTAASLTYWLDGTQVKTSAALTKTNKLWKINIGQSGYMPPAWDTSTSEIFYDDIELAHTNIGTLNQRVTLYCTDLDGRTGISPLAVVSGGSATDTLLWQLYSSTVTNNLATNTLTSTKRAQPPLSLSGLAADTWTLRVALRDSGGTELASDSYVWVKAYAGDPTVAINEYNRFTVSGTPMFLLGNFVDRYDNSEQLYQSNIISVMTGGDWNDRTVAGMSNIMNKLWAVGARTETGFPTPDTPAPDTNWIMDRVTNLTSHAGLFGWFFEDEPELESPYPVLPITHWTWWQQAKAFAPKVNMGINYLGASYSKYIDVNGNTFGVTQASREDGMEGTFWESKTYQFPWLVADYYGNDTYPYSYTNQQSMTSFAVAVRRGSTWNYGLLPSLTFIQPYKLRDSPGAGESSVPPTTNQVQLMFWTTVAAGGSGARWFEYHVGRSDWTNNAWANMQYVGQQLTNWNSRICATPIKTITCDQSYTEPAAAEIDSDGRGVFFKATTLTGTNYIFAVNLSQTLTNITFRSSEFVSTGAVTEVYGDASATLNNGTLEDVIEYEGFRIYAVVDEGAEPDVTPPSPDPMTWSTVPAAVDESSITMTATTATDAGGGIQYYFHETTGGAGATDSGWQVSATYTDSGLSASTQYTYEVKARDASLNETAYSAAESATTGAPPAQANSVGRSTSATAGSIRRP